MTTIITDGQKAFGIPAYIDDDPSAWVWYSEQPASDVDLLYQRVPWLFRSVNLISGGLSKVPWEIRNQAGDAVDTEDDYQDVTGLLPDPEALASIVCKALQLYGQAYLLKVRNLARVLRLQYISPSTISWSVAKDAAGNQLMNAKTGRPIIEFSRALKDGVQKYTEDDLIYFWPADPAVEVGPPHSWPSLAALNASGVINNLDELLQGYFKRGMIKPMIVTASGPMPKEERERVETWLKKLWTGIQNAFSPKVINSDKLSFETIGQDLSEIADLDLEENKRQSIAAAMGIPYSKLFSGSASGLGGGGVATQDDISFYNETVIPAYEFIVDTINIQLLKPMGYAWAITPEEMDIYQEDEASRAASLSQIVGALSQPEQFVIGAAIVGMEIPPEAQEMIDALIAKKDVNRERMAEALQPAQPEEERPETEEPEETEQPQEQPEKLRAITPDHDLWFWKAIKALRDGKPACVSFTSEMIPGGEQARIAHSLKGCETIADVSAIFYANEGSGLVRELRASRELLERLSARNANGA